MRHDLRLNYREVSTMSRRYTAIITKEGNWYIARCLELDVTSQGKTIEEAQANIKEAVELYIESFPEAV